MCGGSGGAGNTWRVEVISVGCRSILAEQEGLALPGQEDTLLLEHFMNCFQQRVGVREPFLCLLSRKCLQAKCSICQFYIIWEFTPTVSLYLLKAWGQ